jgi:hypothetical protein
MRHLLFALAAVAALLPRAADALTPAETKQLLVEQDERQQQTGDYQALAFIERKEKDKNDLVYEAVVYRRDENDKLVILFLQPKEEAGKGYLRIDKSMFFYDPTVGKWERKTERERIAGTDSRRQDFDESRLAEEYDARWIADVKLGKLEAHHLELKAKPGVDVAYPVLQLWIDKSNHNMLKRQEFALSGRLMRTQYFPKWAKLYSESKKGDVWVPQEQRIFDEVEKGNKTTIVIRSVDLKPVSDAYFTKAWLESKAR